MSLRDCRCLFLLAVSTITDGLEAAASDAPRGFLVNWTRSTVLGNIIGLTISAIVRSCTAVTVATIGFSNPGLAGRRRALGNAQASYIGTTMTGWPLAEQEEPTPDFHYPGK